MLCLLARAAFTAIVFVHSATYVLSSNFSAEFPAGARLIAVGGFNDDGYLNDVDIISISTNTHTRGTEMPRESWSFGSAMVNNTLYVIGGGGHGNDSSGFLAYDVAANVWTNLPDFPYKIFGNAAVAWNGSIFSIGGDADDYGFMNYTFKYDASTSVWSKIPAVLPVVHDSEYLYAESLCVVADQSSIYLIVGSGELFRSDDGAYTWKKLSSRLQERGFVACAMLPNGSIMVAGGSNETTGSQNSVDVYNIAENAWANMTPMTKARESASAVVIPGTDTVVVCGGLYDYQEERSDYDDCEQFSMSKNQWGLTNFKLNMPRAYYGLFAL